MQIATEISNLLTWQWVTLITMLVFCRPLGRFLDRALEFKIGRKGVSAKATLRNVPKAGEIEEHAAVSSEPNELIEARRFVLRDSNGKKRAELGVTDTDSALLALYDGTGRARVALYAAAQNGAAVLAFHDGDERPRLMLASSDPRENLPRDQVVSALSIRNKKEDGIAASMMVDADGNPAFDLYSPSGESLFNAQ